MKETDEQGDLRPEYKRSDFEKGGRGKYYQQYQTSVHLKTKWKTLRLQAVVVAFVAVFLVQVLHEGCHGVAALLFGKQVLFFRECYLKIVFPCLSPNALVYIYNGQNMQEVRV